MKKTRRNYTREFKQEAVKLVTQQGYKISEAARNLGLDVSLLRRWRQELQDQASAAALSPDEREELGRLREEIRRLRMERETLKKRPPSSPGNRAEIPVH